MKYTKIINKITAKTFTENKFLEILNEIEDLKEKYHQETDEDEKNDLKKTVYFLLEEIKNATINGTLSLGDNNKIEKLPDNLKIGWNLWLGKNNQIKTLPKNLRVINSIFNLKGDKSEIPEHLKHKIKWGF
jgi:hypothetical protein